VERGLSRIEGRPTATSSTGRDQNWDRRGVDDGSGAVPGNYPTGNTPQATAASRADDPTSEKDRGGGADTRYLAGTGTAGAAANGRPSPEQYHGEQTSVTAPPREPLSAGDSPGVQPNTDVRQQGNGMAPSDPGKETRATADAPYPPDAAAQEQPFRTASQA
jgi:hypothetical protein